MRRHLHIAAIWTLVLGLVFLTLASCITQPESTPAPDVILILGTPVLVNAQATVDDRAVATAVIVRANAQATLDSANATLSAAQIQQQNSSDVVAAQVAAAAEIVRANAQATLYSANATQSAALAQDAIRQTQAQFNVEMTVAQENRDQVAAGTQTAVADLIATQTQSALATAQWYTDQSHQRQERGLSLIASLWRCGLPIFIVLLAGLCLWGFWRWLRIQQDNQRNAGQSVEKLQAPVEPVNPQERFLPPGSDIIDGQVRPTEPGEQMHDWLDETRRKLLKRKKDNDDNPDS